MANKSPRVVGAESIPGRADEMDAGWLGEALAVRYPGIEVESVEIADQAEVTNSHAWLRVRYKNDEAERLGAPESLFCKMLPAEAERRAAIVQTEMGIREAKFYDSLAERLALRVPKAHLVRYDEGDSGAFVLLLEDLTASGCTISTGPESPTPDAAAKALEDLARMHVRFEDPEVRKREAGWIPPPAPSSNYGSMRLQEGLDNHRDRLSDAFAEMAALYIDKRDSLHELWAEGPKSVIHGDAHIGNLFDDAGNIGFLDWGLVVVSTPMRDVSYFLSLCLSIDDRRAHERDLIRHYLEIHRALGGTPISFDAAWRTHRLQAAYLAPASCQIVTFPEDVSERRKRFSAAFLARAEAAIEDLESRSAIREVAGF